MYQTITLVAPLTKCIETNAPQPEIDSITRLLELVGALRELHDAYRELEVVPHPLAMYGVPLFLSDFRVLVRQKREDPSPPCMEAFVTIDEDLLPEPFPSESEDFYELLEFTQMMKFQPGGGLLALPHPYKTIKLWDVEARALVGELRAETENIVGVTFSPDGSFIASHGKRSVTIWNVTTRVLLATILKTAGEIESVQFRPDNFQIALGLGNGRIELWSTTTEKPKRSSWLGHACAVLSLGFCVNGAYVASLSGPNHNFRARQSSDASSLESLESLESLDDWEDIKIWSCETGKLHRTLGTSSDHFSAMEVSKDGKLIATHSESRQTVKLWDVLRGVAIHTVQDSFPMHGPVFHASGNRLILSKRMFNLTDLCELDVAQKTFEIKHGKIFWKDFLVLELPKGLSRGYDRIYTVHDDLVAFYHTEAAPELSPVMRIKMLRLNRQCQLISVQDNTLTVKTGSGMIGSVPFDQDRRLMFFFSEILSQPQ